MLTIYWDLKGPHVDNGEKFEEIELVIPFWGICVVSPLGYKRLQNLVIKTTSHGGTHLTTEC